MAKSKTKSLVPIERIASRIYLTGGRNVVFDTGGRKVVFDFDLAELYGVPTKALNQAVTRNAARFPEDFMFRLSPEETEALNRSQTVTGSQKHRDPRFPPRAFTQEGVAMLSSVLRSKRAIEVNVAIMRAFVRLREVLAMFNKLGSQALPRCWPKEHPRPRFCRWWCAYNCQSRQC